MAAEQACLIPMSLIGASWNPNVRARDMGVYMTRIRCRFENGGGIYKRSKRFLHQRILAIVDLALIEQADNEGDQ